MPEALDHDVEVATQLEIEAEVKAPKPQKDAAKAKRKTVKLTHEGGKEYPVRVSVVGAPKGLVFKSQGDTVEVTPEVAEQVKYLPKVSVV